MKRIFSEMKSLRYALLALAATALLLGGCSGGGGSSYDEPSTVPQPPPLVGQTESVLIDAATLKSWVDGGLVNRDSSFDEKVVILAFGGTYAAGHIPGTQLWASGGIERFEGPVLSSNMVPDGKTMDGLLQAVGIDENTTVVFAGSGNPARLYFLFRYWGFPKDKLKILNGNQAAWTNAGYELTTDVPTVTPSDFSVKELALNPDVRASLDELIKAAETQSTFILNALTNNTEKAGATTGIFSDVTGDYVIFQGSIQGAKHVGNAAFYNADGSIKTAAEIQALLESYGIDNSKPIITYCRAGNAASNAFMPIDVTLGWDAMVYDGSWSQWGSLTNQTGAAFVPDASYALPGALSQWATDGLIEWHTLNNGDFAIPANQIPGPYYNVVFPKTIEKPTFRIDDTMLNPDASGANSIEIEDQGYVEEAGTSDGPAAPVSGGGGGC
jgi:3-mercaptopyruvate sulfurtransferase SseA